jgi:HK97 family phage prohead protease
MQTKTCAVTVKAAGPDDSLPEGVVEAIVATYDVDTVGDQIIPGAFAETLAEYKAAGRPIPFIWSHKSDDPNYHIGTVLEAEERPGLGLWVKAQIDMDEAVPRKIYKLLKGRRVAQYSFAYDELDARPAGEKAQAGARKELHRLKVYEVGPTPIGCNQNTSTLDVKSDPATVTVNVGGESGNADLRLTAALDAFETELKSAEVETKAAPPGFTPKPIVARIRKLVAAAQALLDAVEPSDSNAEKATPASPADSPTSQAAPEAAPEVKAAELALAGTASARLRTDLALLLAEADSYTTEETS